MIAISSFILIKI